MIWGLLFVLAWCALGAAGIPYVLRENAKYGHRQFTLGDLLFSLLLGPTSLFCQALDFLDSVRLK